MRTLALVFSGCATLALTACPAPVEPEPDAGPKEVPDLCNSLEEALTDPQCTLALGERRSAFLGAAGDEDWYSFRTPADANARTLIHVKGGYAVPNTAVNLAINLLRDDGQQSLARKSDRHGQSPPKPVDVVLPFSEANARLVLLVTDDPTVPTKPNFDARAQYELSVEVVQDPDENEPNDEAPTQVTLSQQGGALQGSRTGYLSTDDDVDRYSVAVPAGKKVLYLAITAPALTPPPPFRVEYELYDASGTRIAEGRALNEFLPVNLGTARLTKTGGTYQVVVKGYAGQGSSGPVPGDLRLGYTVEARIFDEVDPSEGANQNDTLATATPVTFASVGETKSIQGRVGYVPDQDWFALQLPASAVPTVLHYRLSAGSGIGRFPALPGTPDRELRIVQQVQTGGTPQDAVNACKTNAAVCPKSAAGAPFATALVNEQCENFSPPRCLLGMRTEHPSFTGLRNFEGMMPIPPHDSAVTFHVLIQDGQNDWADDVDYTFTATWLGDTDEAARYSGGAEQTVKKALAEDVAAASFPVPPSGAAYELTGDLSHGYGFIRDHDINRGQGVRGPQDYDAVPSDRDRFELSLPALTEPLDRTWELQWEVAHAPDGGRPYDLAIELEFCDGAADGGTGACVPVTTGSRGAPLTLSYTSAERNAWHNATGGASVRQRLYDRTETTTETTTTARAYGCFCFEPRFIQGGKLFMTVVAVDRQGYAVTPYTIRTAYTGYPKTFAADGGTQSCPAPGPDAGCVFTRQP